MLNRKPYEFWFVAGSMHLYGPEALQAVEEHARTIAGGIGRKLAGPDRIVYKAVVATSDEIARLCREANHEDRCAGIVTWMHTFSPAKMWIAGLSELRKPLLHLHTQFHRDIPWAVIDMNFMNLNQSAHGDREYGFIGARMGVVRKVVAGFWEDGSTAERIGRWMSAAAARTAGRSLKVARFGDNMRQVAVTEGDKVEAHIQFGWTVDTYGIGDLVESIGGVPDAEVNRLWEEYLELYDAGEEARRDGSVRDSIREQARIELGLRSFLEGNGYEAFTTTFEDLHGMKQLPGLAVQRLMASGYGFGGEGDWKTAALVRLMKMMADGRGTSFMEDYTYHMESGNELVLGAHMLEVCPTLAADRPVIEVHPLAIGGKADPARLVFTGRPGAAVNATVIDLGHRFRLLINEVEAVDAVHEMPKLPVARILWQPQPSLRESAEAWIYAGGAHHTCFSFHVTTEQLLDWAAMCRMEAVVIDRHTRLHSFNNELRWNAAFWGKL